MTEPAQPIDWSLTTWEGAEREQLRRWAALTLEEIVRAQEEMQRLADRLAAGTPPMGKIVGGRSLPAPSRRPSAEQLKAAYGVNEPIAALLPDGRIAAPKGIYRFATLEEGNRQQEKWLAEAMAEARAKRRV